MNNLSFEINVNIRAPELTAALLSLAGGRPAAEPHPVEDPFPAAVNVPQTPSAPRTLAVPVTAPVAVPLAATGTAQAPAAPATPAAPVAPGRTYTHDELAVAATGLLDAGKGREVMDLLQQFGVPSLVQLQPDRYGAFATALRGLGAKI